MKLRYISAISLWLVLVIVERCGATLDLSNLNIEDFQFFKYQTELPNGELRVVKPPPPSLGDHIQKAKAVGTFVQRLLFGYNEDDDKSMAIVFPPTVEHLRDQFQRKYGYRGRFLIEQLGNGDFRFSSGYMPCRSCKW